MALLNRLGHDRTAQGRLDKAEALGQAWRDVRDGDTWVEVNGSRPGIVTVYRVIEEDEA